MILRPDQYISWIGEMDDYESMDSFFRGFMVDQRTRGGAKPAIADSAGKKDLYAGTLPGTNGLRAAVNGQGMAAGNDAVQGAGGV